MKFRLVLQRTAASPADFDEIMQAENLLIQNLGPVNGRLLNTLVSNSAAPITIHL